MRERLNPPAPEQRSILLTAVIAGTLGTGLYAAMERSVDLSRGFGVVLAIGTIVAFLLGLWFGREPALIAFGLLWAPIASLLVLTAIFLFAGGSFSRNYMFGGFLTAMVWFLFVVGLWWGFVAWIGVRIRRALDRRHSR
jgi:hypothetical protein